jgi:pyruvate formate lyase activating enzyme
MPPISTKIERIAGLQKISMIDWEGKMATVVFLSGCNWKCPFCHNFDLCKNQNNMAEEEVLTYLEKKKNWIDGVVLCGGEPLLNNDIFDFVKKIKDTGFSIKLDTNGSFPERLSSLIKEDLVDYVAMDIKTGLRDERYTLATKTTDSLDKVRKSMEVLINSGKEYEFRTTMVPGIVNEEDIVFNLNYIPAGKKYILQQFSNENTQDEKLREVSPYNEDELNKIIGVMKDKGVNAWLRGQ